MTAITITDLSKTYPPSFPRLKGFLGLNVKQPVNALKHISLEIRQGETFGLIGRNGAGKTTLTKIIATLVQPTNGQVKVKGYDIIKDDVKVRSIIGLATAEERSFYWRLTAEQNLMFFARLYGIKNQAARRLIEELFVKLDLTDLAKRRFSELSTGNKQRLAIARALLPDPPILLLDEPTRSLDPLAASSMRELIASLSDVSILLTSHNLSEVEELCDRVAIISKGEIRVIDTPANLRNSHKQTQTVKITLDQISNQNLFNEIPVENHSTHRLSNKLVMEFQRHTEDDVLDNVLTFLTRNDIKVIDVETKKATLMDVLESYEL